MVEVVRLAAEVVAPNMEDAGRSLRRAWARGRDWRRADLGECEDR
jgi:hypothetical protein